jgi:hypothetical protein
MSRTPYRQSTARQQAERASLDEYLIVLAMAESEQR